MNNGKKHSRFSKTKALESTSIDPGDNTMNSLGFVENDYMAPIEIPQPDNLKSKEEVKKRTINDMMEESRENALKVPISSSNKGFKLLMKIGYKEGEGLGKNNLGVIEPISLTTRSNKDVSGIGIEELKVQKQKKIEVQKLRNIKIIEKMKEFFTNNKSQSYSIKKRKKDIIQIRNSIFDLDIKNNIYYHDLWPKLHKPKELEDEENAEEEYDDDGDDDIELLINGLNYLRDNYNYCYYCGVTYEDDDDLFNNCPGLLDSDH